MADPRRGDVWWVQLDPTRGSEIRKTRPCVIVSNDTVNARRRTVVVIPLSSSPAASPPLLVGVTIAKKDAVAVVDQIRAVAKERLQRRVATLSMTELSAVENGLREVLEL